MSQVWFTGGIFLVMYAVIVSERVHRTLAALLGGFAMILIGVLPQAQAFHAIDWNVIFLLAGMMIIANVLKETGLFQWIALQAVRAGNKKPFRVLVLLTIITAFSSAFLDNVTIVVLIAPVTLFVASTLKVNPVPFLIAEILASNIGGMATLVGDPPNILIGSAAGIDFVTFIANLGPISLIILAMFVGFSWFLFGKDMKVQEEQVSLDGLDSGSLITDSKLLGKSLAVLFLVILGFLFHGMLHLQPATVAMVGATILMLWGRIDPHHMLRDVEWTTLFFFVGLFIAVEALVKVGIIENLAQAALRMTGGNLPFTSMLVLWFSAIASGIVDNIPYTATVIPLVKSLGHSMNIGPLWWALALGACLGGNLTIVGAAANVVVASLAEKSGHRISFWYFMRFGATTTMMALILSSIYLWLVYL